MRNKRLDDQRRSKESWERGKGAKKKGNPRYKPAMTTDKNGRKLKVYKLRSSSGSNRHKRTHLLG